MVHGMERSQDHEPQLEARVAQLERQVSELLEGDDRDRSVLRDNDGDRLWALTELEHRVDSDGGVLFAGSVKLPTGERWLWQQQRTTSEVLEIDETQVAAALGALAHPVRLHLLRQIMKGVRTVAELETDDALGTSGQIYHHLRQLVAAGWLHTTSRGQYAVPPGRVVPQLVIAAAALP